MTKSLEGSNVARVKATITNQSVVGGFYDGEQVTVESRRLLVWALKDYFGNVVAEGIDFTIDLGSELPPGWYAIWDRDSDLREPVATFFVLRSTTEPEYPATPASAVSSGCPVPPPPGRETR